MKTLPFDYARCRSANCPEAKDCLRFTDRGEGAAPGQISENAFAFTEKGCEHFIPNEENPTP